MGHQVTLPDERLRAVYYAKIFLRDLLDPKKTPKVPKEIRTRASDCLRHFPANYELEKLPKALPDTFGPIRDLEDEDF